MLIGIYPTQQVNKVCLAVEKQLKIYAFVPLRALTGQDLYGDQLPGAKFSQVFDLNELQDGVNPLRLKQGEEATIVKSIRYKRLQRIRQDRRGF